MSRALLVACATALLLAPSAEALPVGAWAGTWKSTGDPAPFDVVVNPDSSLSATSACPGGSSTGVTSTGRTTSPDNTAADWQYSGQPACPGVGGTFKATMSANCKTVAISGVTQYGTGFTGTWTRVSAVPTGCGPASWSFRTYSNDVAVVSPLVGDYQLGVSRSNGSGKGGSGRFTTTWNPRRTKYREATLRGKVVGAKSSTGPGGRGTRLVLTVEVVDTDARRCAAGDRGRIELLDLEDRLSNGKSSDRVSVSWAHGRCPTFVQGWSNEDGGRRTDPSFGGPPNGGQWAIVRIG